MAAIDVRVPLRFDQLNSILLEIAKDPLRFTPPLLAKEKKSAGWEPHVATELARQASAAIVSNCVMMIWSDTVSCLQALEPAFPLYPKNVRKFVEETRLSFQSYVSLLYHMCNAPYEGTETQRNIGLIVDMRHELEHDKPEPYGPEFSADRIKRVKSWYKKLLPVIGKEALLWVPQVQRPDAIPGVTIAGGYWLTGDATIMKFMKFPVANWVIQASQKIVREMGQTMCSHPDLRTLDEEEMQGATRYEGEEEDLINTLWMGGQ